MPKKLECGQAQAGDEKQVDRLKALIQPGDSHV